MKEMNINIEGYNVNGICVGCLNYNRRMFYHNDVKECYRLLGNIDVPDGLEVQVCWECLAHIRTAIKFKEQMLKSYDLLISYSQEHTFLDSPNDFVSNAVTSLVTSETDTFSYLQDEGETPDIDIDKESDVKEENDEKFDFEIPIKEEVLEESHFSDAPAIDNDMSSDEDIQLSKLKVKETVKVKKKRKKEDKVKKKEEKVKKKDMIQEDSTTDSKSPIPKEDRTKSRKLKNLPEELVELYTMSKEEMLIVREEDLNSKEFQKLKYRCDNCIIAFNTEKLMHDHLNGKHQPKGVDCHQCPTCHAYFLTRDNVSSHRALHRAAYRCLACGFRSALKRRMLRHASTHHTHAHAHVCHTCGTSFSTKSKLTYHRGVCRQERPQCDCCGKVFANKMTLKYHLKTLPQNKDDKPKEKLYIPCKGCDKVFHSKKSYRAHVVIHDGLSYPCHICGKLFQWKRNLARHTRNHREREAGALHECRACGKSFASRDCYNNHMTLSKRHVAEDSYQHECNYCGKKFATKWCLTDHIDWDHLKLIKYQCSVCFKAFKTAKIMVAHVNNIHEGKKKEAEGQHLCEICGKSYKTVKRLKGHVWAMHTKRSTTKSYKCKLCAATFTWQTSIYKHMKMMHATQNKTKTPRRVKKEEFAETHDLTARMQHLKKDEFVETHDLAARMQYFQQNVGGNLSIVRIQPMDVPQDITY